jgi:hypothetical protein
MWSDSQSNSFVFVIDNSEVVIWDVDNGRISSRFRVPRAELRCRNEPGEEVYVTPTGEEATFALFCMNRHVVFNTRTREAKVLSARLPGWPIGYIVEEALPLVVLQLPGPGVEPAAAARATEDVAHPPLVGDDLAPALLAIDVHTGEVRHRWDRAARLQPQHTGPQYVGTLVRTQVHSKGLFAVSTLSDIMVQDLGKGVVLWKRPVTKRGGDYLRFSHDGRLLYANMGGVATILDALTGKTLVELKDPAITGPGDAAFGSGETRLLVEVEHRGNVVLWDWQRNRVERWLAIPGFHGDRQRGGIYPQLCCYLLSSDGKRVAIAAGDLTLCECDAGKGNLIRRISLLDTKEAAVHIDRQLIR